MKKHCFDTNSLILKPDVLNTVEKIVIPYKVLEELDRIKTESGERGFRARQAVRNLKAVEDRIDFQLEAPIHFLNQNNDDYIINFCQAREAIMVSNDYLVQLKCKNLGIPYVAVDELSNNDEHYTGYIETFDTDKRLYSLIEDPTSNEFNLLPNQYLIILSDIDGKPYKAYKRDAQGHVTYELKYNKGVQSSMFEKITPRDMYQYCALDSLMNNQITIIKGKAGSGKSLLTLSYAWSMVESGKKFDKLICFVNPLASRNSAKLGYYPGTRDEKLLDSAVGSMLASKFGEKEEVIHQITKGKLLLLPFSDIRGFDTTGMRAIIWVVEAQNLDIDLMKLAIQRVGEDSKMIIDGDNLTQVDSHYYEGSNNGMRRTSEVFRGESVYGEVELRNIYRSKMAEIADKM